jgi:hypothetical protein
MAIKRRSIIKTKKLSGKITGRGDRPYVTNLLGWREWVALPDLGIPAIKAKIDTGARTSALHAFRIESFHDREAEFVRFWLHPLRNRKDVERICVAPVRQKRTVKDSGGHLEERYMIETAVSVGGRQWNIELTLTSREDMMFRMLLGRSAITRGRLTIDPAASYVTGRSLSRTYGRKKS